MSRPAAGAPTTARRFARAAAVGGVVALAGFLWLASAGTGDLGRASGISGLYELQARSLLQGRWDVPAEAAWIEGIRIDGRTYLYYGPWPALLRLPVVALTDRLDGHLTQASCALAFSLLLAAAAHLAWQARAVVRPGAPWGRREGPVVAATVAAAGLATPAVFAASVPIVYHEAELWGAAWALAAADATVAFARRPSPVRLAWAAAAAAAALFSRSAVGYGSLVALGLLAAAFAGRGLVALVTRSPRPRPPVWRWAVALGLVALLPVVAYAALNTLKFRSKFGLPLDRQVWTEVSPSRRAALAANDWSLFGPKFVPTTLAHYLRPDALAVFGLYPFVDFGRRTSPVIGDVVFDTIDVAASLPTTMPLWLPLAVLGGAAVCWPARWAPRDPRRRDLWVWRPVLAGGVVGVGPTLAIAFIAHRYLIDFVPLVLPVGLLGLELLRRWAAAGGRARRRVAAGALATAGIVGAWVNLGLGVVYQRVDFPLQPADRLRLVETQARLGRLPVLGGPAVDRGWVPPAEAAPHRLFTVGRCAALAVRGRTAWYTLTRSRAAGETRLTVELPRALRPGRRVPVLTTRSGGGPDVVVAWRARRGGGVQTEARVGTAPWIPGGVLDLGPGRHTVVVGADTLTGQLIVEVDGWATVQADRWVPLPERRLPGRAPGIGGVAARFPGRVTEDRAEPGRRTCARLTGIDTARAPAAAQPARRPSRDGQAGASGAGGSRPSRR